MLHTSKYKKFDDKKNLLIKTDKKLDKLYKELNIILDTIKVYKSIDNYKDIENLEIKILDIKNKINELN